MKVSILNLHCLNAVADDFESLDSITADVRRATHGNVSHNEVATCLGELAHDGWVNVFTFDPGEQRYLALPEVPAALADKWFGITDRGREELRTNWVEE
jgi:hypothetical protein